MHNMLPCHDWVDPGRAVAACSHVRGSTIADLIVLGSTCTCHIFGAASCPAVVSAGQRPPTKYQNSLGSQTSVLICILLSMPGTCWADMFIRGSDDATYSYWGMQSNSSTTDADTWEVRAQMGDCLYHIRGGHTSYQTSCKYNFFLVVVYKMYLHYFFCLL